MYELGFYIPEDDIPQSHRRENLKCCTELLDQYASGSYYEGYFVIRTSGH
jgi:hypothetical protein